MTSWQKGPSRTVGNIYIISELSPWGKDCCQLGEYFKGYFTIGFFPLSLPKFPSTESSARRTQAPNWSSHFYVPFIKMLGSPSVPQLYRSFLCRWTKNEKIYGKLKVSHQCTLDQQGHTILPLLCASSQKEVSITEHHSEIENHVLNRLTFKIFPQRTGLQLEWGVAWRFPKKLQPSCGKV